jgi:diacylglycerol O-acyltransferase
MDLRRHLFHHQLPEPGTASQLNALSARIHETMLLHDRPLWELHLIDGLRHGGQAVVLKMHHSITDGIAGVEIAEMLFGGAGVEHAAKPRPCLTFAGSLRPSLRTAAQAMLGVAVTAAGGPIAAPGPFNGPVGARRAFATADIPLDVVRIAKERFGGTVDDVYVAIVTEGIRRHLAETECPDVPAALRAMLPVSTRESGGGGLGNHVTAVFLDLPMAPLEFGELVRAIATSKSGLRAAHAAAGAAMVVTAAGLLPNPVHSAVVRIATGTRACNLVLSDVPAPEETLSLDGRRLRITYPLMPLGASIGIAIAALGIGGHLGVGITVDPDLVPGVQHLAKSIELVVADLERAMSHLAGSHRAA